MEIKEINRIIDNFFNKVKQEMITHVSNFGISGNRDIDSREKSFMLTLPLTCKRKLKEEFALCTKDDEVKKWVN